MATKMEYTHEVEKQYGACRHTHSLGGRGSSTRWYRWMSWRTEGSERTGWPLTWAPENTQETEGNMFGRALLLSSFFKVTFRTHNSNISPTKVNKLSTFLSILLWIQRPRLLIWLCRLPFRFCSRAPCSLEAEPPYTEFLNHLRRSGCRSSSFSLSDISWPTPFISYSLRDRWGAGNYMSPWIDGCLCSLLRFLRNIPYNLKK